MMKVQIVWGETHEVEEINCFGYELCNSIYIFDIPYHLHLKVAKNAYFYSKYDIKLTSRMSWFDGY